MNLKEKIEQKKVEMSFKRDNFKRDAKKTFWTVTYWLKDNYDVLLLVVPAGLGAIKCGSKIINGISRNIALAQEKRIKDLRIYDRSLGKYIELKRPLKQSDMKTIFERRENGEKLSSILMDLRLMK